MGKIKNEVGNRYGRYTVISLGDRKGGKVMWNCICDCGTEKSVRGTELRYGRTVSCGCYNLEKSKKQRTKHGCNHPLYYTHANMIQRCTNTENPEYKNYGARGISVCDRWINSFDDFVEDMGEKPSKNHSIDRVDNNGNYEPLNCKWSTREEQNRNMRGTSSIIKGVTKPRRVGDSRYLVQITVENENKYIGTFKDLFDAICARKSAENKYWGRCYG